MRSRGQLKYCQGYLHQFSTMDGLNLKYRRYTAPIEAANSAFGDDLNKVASVKKGARIEINRGGFGIAEMGPELSLGDNVSITPQDCGAGPVSGRLLHLTDGDVVIQRHNERVGEVEVHFPQIGYKVDKI
jgi:hypothetical protein